MELDLDLKFFSSILEEKEIPNLDDGNSYNIELIVSEIEWPLSVEVIEVVHKSPLGTAGRVLCRTANHAIDYSALNEGVEFFITEAGKMIGKGIVNAVRM